MNDLRLVGLTLITFVLTISLECSFRFAHLTHVSSSSPKRFNK